MRSHKITKKSGVIKKAGALSRKAEGFPDGIRDDEVDECLVSAA